MLHGMRRRLERLEKRVAGETTSNRNDEPRNPEIPEQSEVDLFQVFAPGRRT